MFGPARDCFLSAIIAEGMNTEGLLMSAPTGQRSNEPKLWAAHRHMRLSWDTDKGDHAKSFPTMLEISRAS